MASSSKNILSDTALTTSYQFSDKFDVGNSNHIAVLVDLNWTADATATVKFQAKIDVNGTETWVDIHKDVGGTSSLNSSTTATITEDTDYLLQLDVAPYSECRVGVLASANSKLNALLYVVDDYIPNMRVR